MSMDIASATAASQEMMVNKAQTGLNVLQDSLQQPAQQQETENGLQRAEIAQMTGKGQNIDVKA